MSIKPTENFLPTDPYRQSVKEPAKGSAANSAFEEKLVASAGRLTESDDAVAKIAAAAEILRLDMMRSAISLANAEPEAASVSTSNTASLKLLIDTFLENRSTAAKTQPVDITSINLEAVQETVVEESKPLSGNPSSFDNIIHKAAKRYGVEEGLIKAVIKAESNFNPKAVSHAGAEGLMQLMPATARGLGVSNSFDPEQNVMAGTRFLRDMLNRYGGDLNSALAAYNWGPGNVDKKGAFLPKETRQYLVKVKGYYSEFTG